MKVPFIDITRYEDGFLSSVTEKTAQLLSNGHFVGGPVVAQVEEDLSLYTKSKFTIGCANGTDAIQVALRALDLGPGDKILLPDMTFWATYEAVINVGADPYTLDVSRSHLHLELSTVSQAIEKFKPQALILVHLYGHAAPETLAIRKLCQEKNIHLIEDCAQAMGVEIEGKSLIAGATIATTSFYPAKVLGACGDAGAVFTNDDNLATRCRQLINHGRTAHYEHGLVGWNSRLGAYEANFLVHALRHLDQKLASRRQICERYRKEIKNSHLNFIAPANNVQENGYLSVATMEPQTREKFISYLKEFNIGFGTVYPGAMSDQPGAHQLKEKISFGHATWVAKSVINLPCFAYMTKEETDYVIVKANSFSP
jgi:UDP-2-acetamido-2-deoxy-ribo-hexuluronate aminotransferase